MKIRQLRRIGTPLGGALTVVGLLLIAGCGDDTGLGKRYPVTGQVSYKDQPVAKGQIAFVPVDPKEGRAANGSIENGRFHLTTATPGDGALPGKYKVTIRSEDVDTTQVIDTVKKHGGGGRQGEIAQAAAKAKNLVPARYKLPDTSDLEVTVEARSNTFDFPLKD
jgi:hypothetical protein